MSSKECTLQSPIKVRGSYPYLLFFVLVLRSEPFFPLDLFCRLHTQLTDILFSCLNFILSLHSSPSPFHLSSLLSLSSSSLLPSSQSLCSRTLNLLSSLCLMVTMFAFSRTAKQEVARHTQWCVFFFFCFLAGLGLHSVACNFFVLFVVHVLACCFFFVFVGDCCLCFPCFGFRCVFV